MKKDIYWCFPRVWICASKKISDLRISDHFPLLFTLTFHCSVDKPCAPAHKRWVLNALIVVLFSVAFIESVKMNFSCESNQDLSDIFTSTWTNILDSICHCPWQSPLCDVSLLSSLSLFLALLCQGGNSSRVPPGLHTCSQSLTCCSLPWLTCDYLR